jgi:hypothetical protein
MADRPSQLWKDLPLEKRVAVADAFWRDDESQDIALQKSEVIVALARKLNFRTRSVQALPIDRRARHMAQMSDVSDAVATRALIAYHFSARRDLMAAFLDALGIAHENGLIAEDRVGPPAAPLLAEAVAKVKASFDPADVDLYLSTLVALDRETWAGLEGLASTAR